MRENLLIFLFLDINYWSSCRVNWYICLVSPRIECVCDSIICSENVHIYCSPFHSGKFPINSTKSLLVNIVLHRCDWNKYWIRKICEVTMVCCHHTGWLPTGDIVVDENISCLLCKIVCVICIKKCYLTNGTRTINQDIARIRNTFYIFFTSSLVVWFQVFQLPGATRDKGGLQCTYFCLKHIYEWSLFEVCVNRTF